MRRGAAAWAVFVSALVVYHANLRPVASADSIPGAVLPFAVVLDGTIRLDRFGPWLERTMPAARAFLHRKDGHYYSRYPMGQPLLLTPLYAPAIILSGAGGWPPDGVLLFARILEKLLAAALTAAAVTLFFALAGRFTTRGIALGATAAFAFGTPMWSTNSQALWQHTGGVLLIVAVLLLLVKWTGDPRRDGLLPWAGLLTGLALMVRPTNALLAGAVIAGLFFERAGWRPIARYAVPPVVCAVLVALGNLYLFGDPRGGYALPVNRDIGGALAGLLFSPSRGLFVYCPFLLLAIAGPALAHAAKGPYRMVTAVGALFTGALLAATAVSPMWWGGHCWGPRLLSETSPFLVLMALPALERLRHSRAFRALVVAGVAWSAFLQFVGAFCYPRGYWDDVPVHTGKARERLWDWGDNPVRRTLSAGPVLEPHIVAIEALTQGKPAAVRKMKQFGIRGF